MCTLEEHFINKGREESLVKVARNMLAQGITLEIVRTCTGLTLQKLQELAASLKQAIAVKHAGAVA